MSTLELFAWGANNYGQLANGQPCEQLERPFCVEGIDLDPSAHLELGGGHSLLISHSKLYAAGWNHKGQCGMKNKKDLNLFKEVVHPENIVQVAAGWDFTLAVDDQGQVYGCGSNVFGQLGLGKEVKDVSEFMKISQITEKVVKVSAGMRHSLLLTEQGQLYACGSGKKGQFCNESDEIKINQFTPVPIKFDKKIKDIQTGQNFSVIIFTDGTFRAFGDDRHGQISSVNNFRDYNQVSQIQVGWTHVLFLLKTGHIQAYGRSDYGQISVRQNNLKFQQISSGYEHCLAISDQQNLYSWGWNEHGNCGLGHVDDVFEPTLIDFEGKYHVIRCFAGSGHSFVILQKRPNE